MAEKLIVLDPTAEMVVAQTSWASRPAQFTTVGLVDNGKPNSAELLRKVADRMAAEHPGLQFKYYRKPELSKPAPPALLDQLAAECEVAVVGVGD